MFNEASRFSSTPVKFAVVAALGVFAALAIAAFRLQVVEYSKYRNLARDNYVVQVEIKAPRGDILDCHEALIAGSRQGFSVCAVPRSILKNAREVKILSRILGTDETDIRSSLAPVARTYRPTAVARDVDFATLSVIEEAFADLPDVMVIAEPLRTYPLGPIFSHVIGYVGEATEQDILAEPQEYSTGDFVGRAGIEKQYERHLKGHDGVRSVMFTPGGGTGPIEVDDPEPISPRSGDKLVLYADVDLQRLAFELLDGRRGCIIAVDVKSGGIRAMVSSPAFDPELFTTGISNEAWQAILESPGKPLLNRAVQSAYPPGSTFKVVTAGMALEEGLVSARTRFEPCRGSYRFGNRTFRCWKAAGHGSLDLIGALRVSCDVYFYQMGERLSADVFGMYAQRWNLNAPTGIDLPGEVRGLVPNAAYYDAAYGKKGWTKGVMLNLAIGQGEVLLTPLEMLCFVCAVANRGTYYPPKCVDYAEVEGRVEEFRSPPVRLAISDATLETLRAAMLEVVAGENGTGRNGQVPGLSVAGKTGTAQNPHGADHASFVCFAPYEEPTVAIVVMIENAGHGSTEAAPLARRLLAHIFEIPLGEEVAGR
jgi:penicillin-binding protein 2